MTDAKEMFNMVKSKGTNYSTYHIPKKSGGTRVIDNPSDNLKDIQRQLLNKILHNVPIDKHAHGFAPGRSIYTNAEPHVGAVCVVNLDLKDFFPTVTKEMLVKELSRFVRAPHAIAELATYNGYLPQGSPISPVLSNIVMVRLDRKLGGLAKRFDAVYTRYADDMSFSSKTNKDLHKIIPMVHSFIKKEGFILNYKKTQVMRQGGRQMVTGLVVNKKVNVPRSRVRNFRAEIHQTRLTGEHEDFGVLAQLRGFCSFIIGANKKKGKKYFDEIKRLQDVS